MVCLFTTEQEYDAGGRLLMPFCSGCGTDVGSNAAFCPKCGKPTAAAGSGPVAPGPVLATETGLTENVAGALSYVLGWVTGVVFLLIDKRPFVRFHAMQSIVLFGAIFVLQFVFVWGGFLPAMFGFISLFGTVIGLVALVCWVLCIVKALQGVRFKLPIVGDVAENFTKS